MNKAGFTIHTLVPGIFLAELEFSYRLSDMFSGDMVMDGPEMGEYLADKYKLITVLE